LVSNPGSEIIRVQIINPSITITTTTTLQHVSATTIGGNSLSIHPLPNQRGTTPHHDRNPATAGQYYAPPVAREVARPQVFSGKMKEVSAFVNMARLYIRIKMTEEVVATQVAWVLSYMQRGIAEAWKDNLLDELAKGELEVELAKQLFAKIRNDFGETSEKERKIEQLRTIEQEGRTCNKYVQEFKKVARGSSYERRPLIKEFKQGLNEAIRRKLTEAEEPPTTIGEWQERAVRLDRNQRQSRVEERVLGRNTACPGGNAQPREGRSYRGRGGQIIWRTGGGYRGGGEGNMSNRGEVQMDPRRDPNAMDVDRGRGGDRMCYMCGK